MRLKTTWRLDTWRHCQLVSSSWSPSPAVANWTHGGQSGNIRGLTILRTLLYQLSTAIFFLQPPTSTLYKYALYQFISWERVVRRTNEVTHTSVPVSTEMGDRLRAGMPSPYVTSQLGLCILPGSMNRVPCSGNVIYAAWQVTLVRYGT